MEADNKNAVSHVFLVVREAIFSASFLVYCFFRCLSQILLCASIHSRSSESGSDSHHSAGDDPDEDRIKICSRIHPPPSPAFIPR
jgi:hypothetical protein